MVWTEVEALLGRPKVSQRGRKGRERDKKAENSRNGRQLSRTHNREQGLSAAASGDECRLSEADTHN
jgi:hypothetical protein